MERVFATDEHINTDYVSSINNHGDVVVRSGTTNANADSYIVGMSGVHERIPRAPGFEAMYDGRISDSRFVAGNARNLTAPMSAVILNSPGAGSVDLYQFEYWNNLYYYFGTGVNNSGTVIGYTTWYDAGGIGGACTWNYPGRLDGYLGGVNDSGESQALDINDSGMIVGGSPVNTPCRWLPGGNIQYLAMGDGCTHGWVTSVNEAGWMAGLAGRRISSTQSTSYLQVWDPNGNLVHSIHVNSGELNQAPMWNLKAYINIHGDVAVTTGAEIYGYSAVALWSPDQGLVNVNSLIGNADGFRFDIIRGFNDRGQMVGDMYKQGVGRYYNVLLTPVPEPGSLAVLAFGAVGLMRRRRK